MGMNHLDLFIFEHSNPSNARRAASSRKPAVTAGSPAAPRDPLHWDLGRRTRGFPDASDLHDSNLVDPASSHTLVSKIKPCMSKYKHFIL